jgi:hypothetical protein
MANARKTIGANAYNVHADNDRTSVITLTGLLRYKMSHRLEMQEINGCDFSISYI